MEIESCRDCANFEDRRDIEGAATFRRKSDAIEVTT